MGSFARSEIRIDASFDERRLVDCEFVASGRDTPTLFDLVEEPFDQVARAISNLTKEADPILAATYRQSSMMYTPGRQ